MGEPHGRVVFVLPTLAGGGAEHVVLTVAGALARSPGTTVEVISLLDRPSASHRTEAGVTVTALGARRVRWSLWPLLRELRRRRPSAVVSTLKHVSIGLGLFARWLPRETRHVARVANTYSREIEALGPIQAMIQRALIRVSHRAIPRLVCVSSGVRDDLVATFGVPEDRCTVITNPVDIDRVQELSERPGPTLDEDVLAARIRFLAVGRLEPQKDHESLLRSFTEVASGVDAVLLIAGEGSLRPRLERLATELGIAGRVRFLGFVANPYPLFRMSDVVVLSSRYEGLPNVLLEALALGVPCVATDCPSGPAEILVDPRLGVLVPVGDTKLLGVAMVDAATRLAGSTPGPDFVREHHAVDRAARAYHTALLDRPVEPHGPVVGFVANLGHGAPPNGQTAKARELLGLLDRTGRAVDVVDVGRGGAHVLRVAPMVLRGRTIVIVLNRRGLWVALGFVRVLRRLTRRRSVVIAPVVGGWLADYVAASPRYRKLAGVVDEFLAETPDLVDALRRLGLGASELVNFRDLPVDVDRVRSRVSSPLRLCFAARVRGDKGVVVAARLVERLEALGVPTELDIYGPIEDDHACRAACEISGVRYRGCYSSATEALEILTGYDFLVLPTSYEGECMPGAVVEACFAALPAVVSDWKDLDAVVHDGITGFVCPLDGFVDVAADRILACIEEAQYEALSRNALEHAARRFTEQAARAVLMDQIRHHELQR